MGEGKEDIDLADVKAVLRRLQRLDLPDEPTAPLEQLAPAKTKSVRVAAPGHNSIGVFDRKRAAIDGAPAAAKRRPKPIFIYVVGALALVAGASAIFAAAKFSNGPSQAARIGGEAPARARADATMLLTDARRLLTEGDVLSARKRLLSGDPDKRLEFAFTLAQSYDPNYLSALQKANSPPDRSEAERWYKKWYELAVSSGLEMDSGRLKRIINAMN